jgi:hypothetical protein
VSSFSPTCPRNVFSAFIRMRRFSAQKGPRPTWRPSGDAQGYDASANVPVVNASGR